MTRWLDMFSAPTATLPEEAVYADWDCPQVEVLYAYTAHEEDEMTLEQGELINVLRKMPDGEPKPFVAEFSCLLTGWK